METKNGKRLRKIGRRQLREWRRKRERLRRQNPEWLSRGYCPIEARIEVRSPLRQPEDMQVEILWRENSEIRRKSLAWRTRPATREALTEWMEDYLEMVAAGYKPDGHESPPIPHCARVVLNGRVLAEWMKGIRRKTAHRDSFRPRI